MKKRFLTLDDLYNYYSSTSKKSRHFTANEADGNIVVQVPGNILFEKDNKDTEGLTPVILQACHVGANRNHSAISEKSMKAALPSFSNRPILGYIHEVDGQPEFYDHRMHMEDDKLVYDERPIGIIPESCDAHLEYDADKDKTYVVVYGYLFDEYSEATEILERDGDTKCSVELSIRELSYDAKEKMLYIEDFYFSGVTALGKNPEGEEVGEGMLGSNIKLSDFSQKNNSIFFQQNLSQIIQDSIKEAFDNIINSQRKEENESQMNKEKFEELLAKYNKTVEDIDFEYETLDDEALEKAFAEAFDGEDDTPDVENDPEPQNDGGENENFEADLEEEPVKRPKDDGQYDPDIDDTVIVEEQPVQQNTTSSSPTPAVSTEDDTTSTDDDDDDDDDSGDDDDKTIDDITDNEDPLTYSVQFNGVKKDYSVSLTEKLSALYQLVNDTYSEVDNDFYDVDAYDEDKLVLMHGWISGKTYRQKYSIKKDVYSLQGDRVEVFATYLTKDEQAKLENMKSNYSVIEDELNKFKAEPEKMEILNNDDYASISNSDEFVKFKQQDSHFNMSVDEVRSKADEMLLSAAKAGKVEFSHEEIEKKPITVKRLPTIGKKSSGRYGNLFNK